MIADDLRPAASPTLRYRLGDVQASRRALASSLIGAATALAPVVLAVILLRRLGWAPGALFWAVGAALGALVVVRAVLSFSGARRRLRALVVTIDDDAIRADGTRAGDSLARTRVARLVEIDGALGGLRVASDPDPGTGDVHEIRVPRGGEGYADVRARLESWRPVERRGRRGPAVRLVLGALVVAGIFFIPFLLDDFVVRSRILAAALVGGVWIAMRAAMRGR
jgi:hypothetical protein